MERDPCSRSLKNLFSPHGRFMLQYSKMRMVWKTEQKLTYRDEKTKTP